MNYIKCLVIFLSMLLITGCSEQKFKPAPVINGWRLPAASRNAYITQKGDTVYSIAWAFGMDYRDLAKINNLVPPYKLYRGKKIYIHRVGMNYRKSKVLRKKNNLPIKTKLTIEKNIPIISTQAATNNEDSVPQSQQKLYWQLPTTGKIINTYNNKLGGNKGINIAGIFGQPVLASASGKVVYSGSGIKTLGKLIIIKHNDNYLSAYAHNRCLLAHEGQDVQQGQKIAEMGKNDAGIVMLHFEIRKNGRPVNPVFYLKKI